MNSQESFRQGLETIRSLAAKNGGSVTVADILSAFPSVSLNEEKIGRIYEYLERENITLQDYVPHDTRSLELGKDEEETLSEEDRKLLDLYLEDLEAVKPLDSTEMSTLAAQLRDGPPDKREKARERLAEGNLHYAVSLAREFAGKGVPFSDLIQEANLSLVEGLNAYSAEDGELEDFLEKKVRKDLRAMLREEAGFSRMQEDMTNAANRILEEVKKSEAEDGRPLQAEDLAKRLGMPVRKVEEVLQESAKAIRNAEK